MEIIKLEQISFIKGRFILDNIIGVAKGTKWTRETSPEAMFLKLDIEKAYDRVK